MKGVKLFFPLGLSSVLISPENARRRYLYRIYPFIDESLVDTEFGTWLSNGLLAGKGCQ